MRQDSVEYPILALREAVVNALIHRSYVEVGGAVSVAIFADRLEVWNDGVLPFGQLPEELKRSHPSRPRNPLVANDFFRRGLIEGWGSGTQKIVELCVAAGHPEPEFWMEGGSWMVVTFRPRVGAGAGPPGTDRSTAGDSLRHRGGRRHDSASGARRACRSANDPDVAVGPRAPS